jgi:hypothetical protein
MPLNAKAEAVLQAFGKEPGVTPDQLKNLTDTINNSPALVDEITVPSMRATCSASSL